MQTISTKAATIILDDEGRWAAAYGKAVPSSLVPHVGARFFDTDAYIEYYWTGESWSALKANPVLHTVAWDDLRFPAAGINPTGAVGEAGVDASSTFMGTLLFDKASTEIICGIAQMPHCWKPGTNVHPHIHWGPVDTGNGNVAWKFSYQVAAIGGTFPASLTTAGIEVDAADGVANKHQMHEFSEIDMSAISTVSAMIVWKLERVGGDGSDTYDNDARLFELDFHYQIDRAGSANEDSY